MKKIIGAVLSAIMLLSAFSLVGCGKKDNFKVNWDIDLNNKIKLNMMFQNSGTTDTDFNNQNKDILQAFKKGTEYDVTYNQLPATSADEIVNNHIINREKYHAMKLSRAQFEMNVHNGAFLELNDLLDKWGPNLKSKIKESSWSATTVDGKIYAIPETGFGYMQDFTIVCRTDMLQKAGITNNGSESGEVVLPTNIAELDSAMAKLKTKYGSDPQYNPLGYSGSTTIVKPVATALGLPARYFVDSDDKVKHYVESPKMLEYLNQMSAWVEKGYSAKSFVTTTSQNVMANLASGKISMGYLPYWYIDPLYEIMKGNGISDPESKIDWIYNLEDTNGKMSYIQDEETAYYIAIPFYMAENAGYAIDWLDKKITDDMWTRMSIGEEGVHYNVVDGEKIRTDRFGEVLDNSFYLTGNNKDVAKDCWGLREQVFRCWSVMLPAQEEKDLVKVTALNGAPPFKKFGAVRERGESFMLGNFQNIMSQNKGEAGWKSAINTWKAKTWTPDVEKEVNDWYKASRA